LARQAERTETTRSALIGAARACFMDEGFEGTSTEAILARAGVSKGALYHHFASKTELLAAVFEAVSLETLAKAQSAAAGATSSRAALRAGLKAWLRAVLAPEAYRIILETGPAVLGYARARKIEERITQAPTREALARAVELGEARCPDVDLVARLLNAAVAEMALTAVQRELKREQLQAFDPHIDAMINALLELPLR
jgi:AcrR family transcriptional regulator